MSIFVSIVGLGFLILIHEAGHFFVARAVAMFAVSGRWPGG